MRSAPRPASPGRPESKPHAGDSGMGRVSGAGEEAARYRLRGLVWPEKILSGGVCMIVPWRPASIYECPIACSPPGGVWHRPEKIKGIALYRPSKAMSAAAVALSVGAALSVPAAAGATQAASHHGAGDTTTPIKHLVVIFQENVSFDHYFGTYPKAANTSGQPFHASKRTPRVNNLANTPGAGGTGNLLTNNPNQDAGGHQVNPRRYDPANINDILTCDQDHDYGPEQMAFDGGKMDKFVTTVGTGSGTSPTGQPCKASDVMNYYDGNTVTGLWNYAQHFAMSDNSFDTTFGPSSPGAINLASGETGGVGKMINGADTDGDTVPDGQGGRTLISDAQPYYDDCSTRDAASMNGKNIGDLLNAAGLSWGWFQGGFAPPPASPRRPAERSPPAPLSPTSSRASSPPRPPATRAFATPSIRSARQSAAPAASLPGRPTTATRTTT